METAAAEPTHLMGWLQILIPLAVQTAAIFWKMGRSEERLTHVENAMVEFKNEMVRKETWVAERQRLEEIIRNNGKRIAELEARQR